MRYAGGGVGHYRVTLSDTPANVEETPQDDFAMDDDIDPPRSIIATTAESAGCGDVEDTLLDDDNQCSDSEEEDEEEDEDNPDEDDLGAEDGEGGFLDAEDDEGYAAL